VYALEPLAQLHGIRTVEFEGVQGAFIDKLLHVMTSKVKIEVPVLAYDTVKFRKKLASGKMKVMERLKRRADQPWCDWDAIELPRDAV
jgi:hypothetical protein